MRAAFDREGELRSVALLAAFVALWRENQNGRLRARRAGGDCGFDVRSGELVGVSTSDPRFETSAILVRAGKLDAAALERLAVPETSDRSLAALQSGIITKREWRWGEKIRAIEVLADLLTWIEGEYEFDSAANPQAGEFRLAIPRLILELFLRSRDRNLIEHQLGPADASLVRADNFDREFSTFGLTADAESVVQLIDGRATAADISRKAPADDFAVQKLLAALIALGLVRPEYAPEEPARTVAVPLSRSEPQPPGEAFEAQEWTPPPTPEPVEATAAFDEPMSPEQEDFAGPESVEEQAAEEPRVVESDWENLTPAGVERLNHLERVERGWDEAQPEPIEPSEPAWEEAEVGVEREPLDQALQHPVEVASATEPRRSTGRAIVWTLALLLVAGAAVYFLRSRREAPALPGPVPTAPTAPAALAPEPSPAPAVAPTAAPPTTLAQLSAVTPVRPAATAAPPRPTAAPPRLSPIPVRTDARSVWLERALRDQRRLTGEAGTRYAIQLELACEIPTLVAAWKHDRPAGTMWLLSVDHRGRDCFRVLWGRYGSLEAARAAKPSIPSFFVTGTNRPAVVGVR